jgi:hypothetical protein
LSQNPYTSEEYAVPHEAPKGDTIASILPLCILIALTALHTLFFFLIFLVMLLANADARFELTLLEVATMAAVTIGLALRQEWARIMLLVNAYTMLAVAVYFVLSLLAKRVDGGGVLIAVYVVLGGLALLMIVLAHWVGKVTREASVPKTYIYQSPKSSSETESHEP